MKVHGEPRRTIWLEGEAVRVIDQRALPFAVETEELTSVEQMARAIREMHVRGAGLIGAAAGYGLYLAARTAAPGEVTAALERAAELLRATRPTARNLAWALERQLATAAAAGGGPADGASVEDTERIVAALRAGAERIAEEDMAACRAIGEHGAPLLEAIAARKEGGRVEILTHCNAGWLAFVDVGSATAPIYEARDRGVDLHVWIDETRPWNQGSRLTAWELGQEGIAHTVIVDSAGGYLMQQGRVDIVLVGADRVTPDGWVANKIGTYLKAVAAADSGVPFYAAFPAVTVDPAARGPEDIVIEERDPDEVLTARGLAGERLETVRLAPPGTPAANPSFDLTPPRLITGYITERGIATPSPGAPAQFVP